LDFGQFSILAFVLGMNSPSKVFEGFFNRIWGK